MSQTDPLLARLHSSWSDRSHVVIGMIHLPALAGAPMYRGAAFEQMRESVLQDVEALSAGGVHGLMIENFGDVDVKHSAALAARPIQDEVDDLIERALADAVIVSGAGTGKTTDLQKVRQVKEATKGRVPVLIGSGITADTIAEFLPHA